MNPILIASDLSARSERALRRGLRLAALLGAEPTVLHVVDEELPEQLAATVTEQAQSALERLAASISDRACNVRVVTGGEVETILAEARRLEAGLIVLGQHRIRPFWDMFLGTTMERLVRASERPVLVVRDAADHDYARVLCGIDLSPSAQAAARLASDIAPGSELRAFHAVHVPFRGLMSGGDDVRASEPFVDQAREPLATWWAARSMPRSMRRPEPQAGSVTQVFQAEVARFSPDLVAVGAHGRSALAPTLLGGFTQDVLQGGPCDVLVVRREGPAV